jgi:hypothetical protein
VIRNKNNGLKPQINTDEKYSLPRMGVPVPGMRAKGKYHKGWLRVV